MSWLVQHPAFSTNHLTDTKGRLQQRRSTAESTYTIRYDMIEEFNVDSKAEYTA